MKHLEVDVLVVGSGAGGLAAAVSAAHRGLEVVVAEKEPVFGGTTARSGGWMWVPNNAPGKRAGLDDSLEKARTYLKHETGAFYDHDRIEAFLEAGPKAIEFFETETALEFDLGPTFADYHCDAPGGMDAGRSFVARPFDGRELGPEIKRLRPPMWEITMLGMMIGSGKELLHFFNVTRSPVSMVFVVGLVTKFAREKLLHGRAMRLVNGNALIGRLAKSCFDKDVPIWTSSAVTRLMRDDAGKVTGAIVQRADGPVEITARKGVVLAAGGFPQDAVRCEELITHTPTGRKHVSLAPPGNTGDGLRLGETVGAEVKTDLPNAAAWVPISRPPRGDGTLGTFPHFVDRSKPGVIAVTRSGRRFVNEAQSYHDFSQAMIKRCRAEGGEEAEIAAWFIADHRTFRRYGLGYAKPSPVPYGKLIKQGYLIRGKTLRELADQIGADGAQLEKTVAAFNTHAVKGEDPEFGKGSTAYNRSLGDPKHEPNPCLAPIEQGPFYAVRLHVSDLGTYAGLQTNQNAQVVDQAGRAIEGLYAAGNDAASIMGGNYPGGGITLGPALTFGYVAARHMSGENA
ncbi:FAD-dependent oxidoreductase [Celeribacter naphthalenivorans]|uniref:FAD-dependent oxidoreductase n=1 Tax=Celeribacter naphthalenivorans TaxID=1614694 RepID=UPI001CF962B0|nr:FAD-dependent oxidoreductase [Celeribacter naphthalenivorans]